MRKIAYIKKIQSLLLEGIFDEQEELRVKKTLNKAIKNCAPDKMRDACTVFLLSLLNRFDGSLSSVGGTPKHPFAVGNELAEAIGKAIAICASREVSSFHMDDVRNFIAAHTRGYAYGRSAIDADDKIENFYENLIDEFLNLITPPDSKIFSANRMALYREKHPKLEPGDKIE